MLIEITNLFGTFKADKIEDIYFGSNVVGFRAVVVESELPGWKVGELVECGTLTTYKALDRL